MSRKIVATWKAVLTLPHRLALMTTPCAPAATRDIVTASSRAMMTIATHAASRSSETSATSAAMTSSLSAIGSMSLPNVDTFPRERASQPSTQSVAEATAKTIAASRSPLGVSSSSAATTTGTSRMRSTVRTLGTLGASIARPSGLEPPSGPEQPRAPRDARAGQSRGHAQRESDADVAGAQEAVAHRLHEVECRVQVRQLMPRRGQQVDRVEDAAEERQREDHEVVDEARLVPRLGVDAHDDAERAEEHEQHPDGGDQRQRLAHGHAGDRHGE